MVPSSTTHTALASIWVITLTTRPDFYTNTWSNSKYISHVSTLWTLTVNLVLWWLKYLLANLSLPYYHHPAQLLTPTRRPRTCQDQHCLSPFNCCVICNFNILLTRNSQESHHLLQITYYRCTHAQPHWKPPSPPHRAMQLWISIKAAFNGNCFEHSLLAFRHFWLILVPCPWATGSFVCQPWFNKRGKLNMEKYLQITEICMVVP